MKHDDSATDTHDLHGLEPDNLLAFLAMLGLLRAIETARPVWAPRINWTGVPPKARLQLATVTTRDDLLRATDEGIRALGPAFAFEQQDLTFTAEEYRELFASANSQTERVRVLAALGSDGALKRDSVSIEPTPLCVLFGQGHQHFLSRLGAVTARDASDGLEELARALFEEWQYADTGDSFRWDPIEDRRYAHQAGDPSVGTNKLGTVAGANRLAAIGFAEITTAPTQRGLVTLGVSGRRGECEVCWPIPSVPTRLVGYLALLEHPHLSQPDKAPLLKAYGVTAVARARRYQVGKFFNFERARLQVL
ncbi:MAG TPA: hypothetical protein PLE87_21390 [Phycisphaerae bacterium]|nr:hypothetical protein [Phycisphaerae bacterium]